jgi:hypothetical protein
MRVILALVILFQLGASSYAFCYEPSLTVSVPDAPGSFARPSVPYCLSDYSWSGRHTCDSWELDSYKRNVDDYIAQLNRYIEEANDLASSVRRFAEEAYDYAVCEANEVSAQHQ